MVEVETFMERERTLSSNSDELSFSKAARKPYPKPRVASPPLLPLPRPAGTTNTGLNSPPPVPSIPITTILSQTGIIAADGNRGFCGVEVGSGGWDADMEVNGLERAGVN